MTKEQTDKNHKCIDVCYKVLKMLIVAGEKTEGLCLPDTSGVNHEELLRRLEKYEFVLKVRYENG